MRWFGAGVSFAVCVGLGVAAVSIRSDNTGLRARLDERARRLDAHRIEHARRRADWSLRSRPDRLARHALDLMALRRQLERRGRE